MDKIIDKLKEFLNESITYGLSGIQEQSANSCLVEAIEHIEHLEAENAKQQEVIKNISIANERMKAKYVKLIQAGDEIIDLVEADANYQLKVKITKFDKTHRTNKKDLLNKIKADAIREATESLSQNINTNGTEFDMCYSSELEDYADSIESSCQ